MSILDKDVLLLKERYGPYACATDTCLIVGSWPGICVLPILIKLSVDSKHWSRFPFSSLCQFVFKFHSGERAVFLLNPRSRRCRFGIIAASAGKLTPPVPTLPARTFTCSSVASRAHHFEFDWVPLQLPQFFRGRDIRANALEMPESPTEEATVARTRAVCTVLTVTLGRHGWAAYSGRVVAGDPTHDTVPQGLVSTKDLFLS